MAKTAPTEDASRSIVKFATLTRLAVLTLLIVANALSPDYDSSSTLLLHEDSANGPLDAYILPFVAPLLRWDAVYFLAIAQNGYTYEQETAFFPGLPLLMRLLSSTVLWPLHAWFSPRIVLLIAAILISNGSSILASLVLYRLSKVLVKDEDTSRFSAILFALTPSAAFMSAPYTESPFALLSFLGMLASCHDRWALAAVSWAAACTLRSNGLLHAGFFLYRILQIVTDTSLSPFKRLGSSLLLLTYAALTTSAFIAFQAYGYSLYCMDPSNLRPWCNQSPPLLYSYVQDIYWNCGPFRYYTLQQLPNFLIAAPIILLSSLGIYTYIQASPRRFLTLGFGPERPLGPSPYVASSPLTPYIALWAVQLVYALINIHIQVIIRFLTSQPAMYIYAAACLRAHLRHQPHLGGRAILYYFPIYGTIGTVLFANFLPPA